VVAGLIWCVIVGLTGRIVFDVRERGNLPTEGHHMI
jgi:hypothetical protein